MPANDRSDGSIPKKNRPHFSALLLSLLLAIQCLRVCRDLDACVIRTVYMRLASQGIRFWRKASATAWVRLRTPSLICAFFRWLRIVSSPSPSARATS
jgi:hypothetical protein